MEQDYYLSLPAYRATNESFSSASSASSSYDIEVDVGRDVLTQISCSLLSRILDFPDSKLETLLGEPGEVDESREDHNHYHLARNISSGFKHVKKSIEKGIQSFAYHRQGLTRMKEPGLWLTKLVLSLLINHWLQLEQFHWYLGRLYLKIAHW